MEQHIKKKVAILRSKNRTNKFHSQQKINKNWQLDDWKAPLAAHLYKCMCNLCYQQFLKIPGVLKDKYQSKIDLHKTKFLFSCLISKGKSKPLNIMIIDSCFYSQNKPEKIYQSLKGIVYESKTKQLTEKYVFNILVQQNFQNKQNARSLLVKNQESSSIIPIVNTRFTNSVIPPYSNFNQSSKSILYVKTFIKRDVGQLSNTQQNSNNFVVTIYYKDKSIVLLNENNFDKIMMDRLQGNPHIYCIQTFIQPKMKSKQNYYGTFITSYNKNNPHRVQLHKNARANIMKYLNKDPFAVSNVNEDLLSKQELAQFQMFRIIEYFRQIHDIIVNSVTLTWVYTYCTELDHQYSQKIDQEPTKTQQKQYFTINQQIQDQNQTFFDNQGEDQKPNRQYRKRIKQYFSKKTYSQKEYSFHKWEKIKKGHLDRSKEKIIRQNKLVTDESQIAFKNMFPHGDFQRLKTSDSKLSRLSKTASVRNTQQKTPSSKIKTYIPFRLNKKCSNKKSTFFNFPI